MKTFLLTLLIYGLITTVNSLKISETDQVELVIDCKYKNFNTTGECPSFITTDPPERKLHRRAGWSVQAQYSTFGDIPSWGQLSSISRFTNSMHFFFLEGTASSGYTPSRYTWSLASGWSGTPFGPLKKGTYVGVAGLSRISDRAEVFYVSGSGISSYYWTSTGGWSLSAISKGKNRGLSTFLAAISTSTIHMEIFYVNPDGVIMNSYTTTNGGPWVTDHELIWPSTRGYAMPRSLSATVWGNNMANFWVTNLGALRGGRWTPGTGWLSYTYTETGFVSSGSGTASVSRAPGHLSVFYVDSNAKVVSLHYSDSSGTWTRSQVSSVNASPGGLAASSLYSTHEEVFFTTTAGVVWHAYYTTETNQWIHGPVKGNTQCVAGSSITALARKGASTTDVWCRANWDQVYFNHFSYVAY